MSLSIKIVGRGQDFIYKFKRRQDMNCKTDISFYGLLLPLSSRTKRQRSDVFSLLSDRPCFLWQHQWFLAGLLPKYTFRDTLHSATKLRDRNTPTGFLHGMRGWLDRSKIYDDILLDWLFACCPPVQKLSADIIWHLIRGGSGCFDIKTCKYANLTRIWHQSHGWDVKKYWDLKIYIFVSS